MKDLTPIEILEKLDVFYNNAWNKLILFTTIMLAIVGVVYPIIINWWQNRNLRLREESLKKELNTFFEDKLRELKKELSSSVDTKFENKINEIKKYQEKIKSEMEGSHFHLQANSEEDSKEKLKSLVWSAQGYLAGDDFMNLNTVLEMIITELPKIGKDDLEEMEVEEASIPNLLEKLESNDNNNSLTRQIRSIKIALGKVEKKKNNTQQKI